MFWSPLQVDALTIRVASCSRHPSHEAAESLSPQSPQETNLKLVMFWLVCLFFQQKYTKNTVAMLPLTFSSPPLSAICAPYVLYYWLLLYSSATRLRSLVCYSVSVPFLNLSQFSSHVLEHPHPVRSRHAPCGYKPGNYSLCL